MRLSTIFLILTTIVYAHAAAIWLVRAPSTRTVTVKSQTDFCSFLPRKPGQEIGASESTAVAFCTKPFSDAPGAKIFPSGFIKTAHFKKTANFVQVTGTIDRTKYKLSKRDGGGQYDTRAPSGAVCAGFKNFVNLVEPDVQRFCIRCCTNTKFCNTSESTKGCEVVVPGTY